MTKDKNFKDTIEKLESVNLIEKNMEYIEKKIEILDYDLAKLHSNKDVNGHRIKKLLDEKTKLINDLDDLKLEKKFIVEAVNILEGIEREVIIDFYFKNYSVTQISNLKLYSDRRIRQIKKKALLKLSLLFN